MRKALLAVLLCLLLLMLCSGCSLLPRSFQEDTVLAEVSGQDVHILFSDAENSCGTVEAENGTYSFQYENADLLRITYPDGKVYTWAAQVGSWPYDQSESSLGYLPGKALAASLDLASGVDAARQPAQTPASGLSPVISVLIAGLGFWLLLSPKGVWRLLVESFRPEAEPRKRTLLIYRLAGAVLAVAGCLLLFL